MTKISELGRFVLIDDSSQQYPIKDGVNLICIKGTDIFIGNEVVVHRCDMDALFIISLTENSIVLFKSYGEIYANQNEIEDSGYELSDNDIIKTINKNIKFKFICDDLNLEKLIDVFMDGNLYFSLDMDCIFYEYAKKLKITDKKAISSVMATIDIPEIDRL